MIDELERRSATGDRAAKQLERYRRPRPCPDCEGARLRAEARSVELGGGGLEASDLEGEVVEATRLMLPYEEESLQLVEAQESPAGDEIEALFEQLLDD